MNRTLIWEYLATFDLRSSKRFLLFLESPYHNTRTNLRDLADFLFECLLQLDIVPTKEKAFAILFPNQSYDNQVLRLHLSYLTKLVEAFWILEHQEKGRGEEMRLLLQELKKRGLQKAYQKRFQSLAQQLNQPRQDRRLQDYLIKHQFELDTYQTESESQRTTRIDLPTLSANLDRYYFVQKLRMASTALMESIHRNERIATDHLQPTLYILQDAQFFQDPFVQIYYHIFCFSSDLQDETAFTQYVDLLPRLNPVLAKTELYDIYGFGINYCTYVQTLAEKDYSEQNFFLHQQALDLELFTFQGPMSKFIYRNIVRLAIRVNQLSWTEQFIEEYRHHLSEQDRKGAYYLNLGVLHFHQEKYDQCLQLLQNADLSDKWLVLAVKCGISKCYVELGEYEPLYYNLNAMEQYIRRNQIGHLEKAYLNFIKYTRRLENYNYLSKDKKSKLRLTLQNENEILEKEWLLTKMDMALSA